MTSDIIRGETIDWRYQVDAAEETDCSIVTIPISIGRMVIDFFTTPSDPNGDLVLDESDQVNSLEAGGQQVIDKAFTFSDTGVYMVDVEADATQVIDEANENNNRDNQDVETRLSSNQDDYFSGASEAFLERLKTTAAIVIVPEQGDSRRISEYRGIPVYFVK